MNALLGGMATAIKDYVEDMLFLLLSRFKQN